MASHLALKTEQKQAIIEAFDEKERLELIYQILLTEIEILEVEKEINEKVRGQINRLQKEYYLKEQMKAIKEELGEDYDYDEEIQEFQEKLEKLKMPADVKEKVMKEIDRMARLAPASAEGASSAPTSPGFWTCPGITRPRTPWTSRRPARSWTRTITA